MVGISFSAGWTSISGVEDRVSSYSSIVETFIGRMLDSVAKKLVRPPKCIQESINTLIIAFYPTGYGTSFQRERSNFFSHPVRYV